MRKAEYLELVEVRLPDDRLVDLTVDCLRGSYGDFSSPPDPHEVAITEGWLLDADADRVRELSEEEIEAIGDDDEAYQVVLDVALDVLNERTYDAMIAGEAVMELE